MPDPRCELSFIKVRGESCGWMRGPAYLAFLNFVDFEDPCSKVTNWTLFMDRADAGEGKWIRRLL